MAKDEQRKLAQDATKNLNPIRYGDTECKDQLQKRVQGYHESLVEEERNHTQKMASLQDKFNASTNELQQLDPEGMMNLDRPIQFYVY